MLPTARRRRTPPARRAGLATALALSAALLLTSCTLGPSPTPSLAVSGAGSSTAKPTTTATSPMPTGPGGPGQRADPVQWQSCAGLVPEAVAGGTAFTVRCGTVAAPVSYSDRSAGMFELYLAEARTDATPDDAPVLLLADGDPGEHSIADIVSLAAALPEQVRNRYAIVTVDPRGTGMSLGVSCLRESTVAAILGMAADPSSEAGRTQLAAIGRQLTFDCGDTVGPALTKLNSTNAADDLDTVRAALDVSSISIVASGGGATVGAAYVDRYPGRVVAAALDSPADPLATWQSRATLIAAAAEQLFDDFAAACPLFPSPPHPSQQDPAQQTSESGRPAAVGCPLGDNPRSAVMALIERYATSGTRADQWVMTGGSVLLALLDLLPDSATWPDIARALADLQDGDAGALARLLTGALADDDTYAKLTADIMYTCNDTAARPSLADIAAAVPEARKAAPLFGAYALALAGLCTSWPVPDEALTRFAGTGAPPVIVIGSVLNPLHPFGEAQSVAGQLASAVLVSWQSGTDGAYPANACVSTVVSDYLTAGTVPERGVLCPP